MKGKILKKLHQKRKVLRNFVTSTTGTVLIQGAKVNKT